MAKDQSSLDRRERSCHKHHRRFPDSSPKGDPFSRVFRDLFVHLVNHSTYHRGQAVTMLRQLGKAVQATDFLLFLDAQKARPAKG